MPEARISAPYPAGRFRRRGHAPGPPHARGAASPGGPVPQAPTLPLCLHGRSTRRDNPGHAGQPAACI